MRSFRPRFLQAAFISFCICPAIAAQGDSCLEVPFSSELGFERAIDEYLKVALNQTICTDRKSGPAACEPVVQRREADYLLAFAGGEALAPSEAEEIVRSAFRAADLVRPIIGHAGYLTPREKNRGLMEFMIVDSKRGRENPKVEFDLTIAKIGLDRVPDLYGIYSRFMTLESEACLTLNISNDHGKIVASSTWIKSESSTDEKLRCATRGVIGGLGLNADDMFKSAPQSGTASNDIPDKYLKYLALHYNERIRLRYNAAQATEVIKEISCK